MYGTQLGHARVLRLLGAGVAVSALGCGALASAASAATISVGKACYVNTDPTVGAPMTITGSGFTPGDQVVVSGGSVFAPSPTADADGGFSVTTGAPVLSTSAPAARSFTLTATDDTDSGAVITASTSVRAANLAMTVNPSSAPPSKKVTYTFSGFRQGKRIYAHYVHGKKALTYSFGTARGACGQAKVKAKLFPGGRPRYQKYTLQFDDSRKYSKRSSPRLDSTLTFMTH